MEYFLHKHLSKENRSYIAIGRHPLPTDWTYPKELPVGFHYPPCAGGIIPEEYREVPDLTEKPIGEKGPNRHHLPHTRVHTDHEGYSNNQDCSDLNDTIVRKISTPWVLSTSRI
jgi:hypothetical protein